MRSSDETVRHGALQPLPTERLGSSDRASRNRLALAGAALRAATQINIANYVHMARRSAWSGRGGPQTEPYEADLRPADGHQPDDDDSIEPISVIGARVVAVAIALVLTLVLSGGLWLVMAARSAAPPPAAPLPADVFSLTATPATTHPAPTGEPVARANRLLISSLHIDAAIIDERAPNGGLTSSGDTHVVGHRLDGASLTSSTGTVVLAGHVEFAGEEGGALDDLYQVQPGAQVVTTDSAGRATRWIVIALQVSANTGRPTALATHAGPRRLDIVTFGGPLSHVDGADGGYNTYADDIIVTAVPA
jgi:hypothetical protein